MTNREFNETRTKLLMELAEAGRAALEFQPLAASALAAIPNTEPPKYVVAGTLQMIAKMLPGVEPTSPAVSPAPAAAGITEHVRAAMKRAYSLGQTYWQQADSEYTSQHKKADVTAGRFIELTDETCAEVERLLGAHAGVVVAEPVYVPRATLLMIYEAMNHMGDILNGMDACEDEDEEATTPAFEAIRALLDDSYIAAPAAQAPVQNAEEVRRDALEEAAKLIETAEIPFDVDVWMKTTKKGMTGKTALALAAAIRALKNEAPAASKQAAAADAPVNRRLSDVLRGTQHSDDLRLKAASAQGEKGGE